MDANASDGTIRFRRWRLARQTLALAAATFREAVRMKAFAAPVAFALTAAVASPFLPSDGTAAGAVRLAITVNLIAASVFGAVAAIALPSVVYAREVRDRTAYLVATKPVPRWGLYAGRALGLSAVLAVMFAGMAALSWALVWAVAAREGAGGPAARQELADVFAVRATVRPVAQTGPERSPEAGPVEAVTVPPGGRLEWRFGVPPHHPRDVEIRGRVLLDPPGADVVVGARNPATGESSPVRLVPAAEGAPARFVVPARLVAYDDTSAYRAGAVVVELVNRGDRDVRLSGAPPVMILAGAYVHVRGGAPYVWEFDLAGAPRAPAFRLCVWRSAAEPQRVRLSFGRDGGEVVVRELVLGPRPLQIVPVPDELVRGPVRLAARLEALDEGSVRVPAVDGLTFAPRSGTFAGAIARWALVEYAKAVFLVLVTCAGATFLSFPIPALLGGAFAVGGYLIAFVSTLATAGSARGSPQAVAYAALGALLPDLAGLTVVDRVTDGVLIPAGVVLWALVSLVVVRGGVAALVGAAMSHRREFGA